MNSILKRHRFLVGRVWPLQWRSDRLTWPMAAEVDKSDLSLSSALVPFGTRKVKGLSWKL